MDVFFTQHSLLAVVILTIAAVTLLVCPVRLAKSMAAGAGTLACAVATLPAIFAPSSETLPVVLVCTIAALASMLLLPSDLERDDDAVESTSLILLGAAGGIVLATTTNLLSMMLGLETLSLSAAVLTALGRGPRALEASFKFFVLGAVSVATMVYGMALITCATGSLDLGAPLPVTDLERHLRTAGLVLLVLGIAFELAIVPMQFGALGAYTVAPTAVAGFAMTTSKLAAGLAMLKVANVAGGEVLHPILVALGTLSILWATFAALAQVELRAMLAYSAVAHAGFLTFGIGLGEVGRQAAVFYAVTYVAAVALVFASLAGRSGAPITLASLRAQPLDRLRSAGLALGLLSLAGVPPSPGFWAKLGVLVPGWSAAGPWWTILATTGGVLGALYYLRPLPDLLAGARDAATTSTAAVPGSRFAVTVLASVVLLLTAMPFLATQLAAITNR